MLWTWDTFYALHRLVLGHSHTHKTQKQQDIITKICEKKGKEQQILENENTREGGSHFLLKLPDAKEDEHFLEWRFLKTCLFFINPASAQEQSRLSVKKT